jgi:hypothetical protein
MASENNSGSAASPSPAEQSDHSKAAAEHAQKRAARKLKATGKGAKRNPRVIDKALEPKPAYAGTTGKERDEIDRELKAQSKADSQAALATPSELTPLQLQRLEQSEKVKDSKKKPSRLNREAKERARRDRFNSNPD